MTEVLMTEVLMNEVLMTTVLKDDRSPSRCTRWARLRRTYASLAQLSRCGPMATNSIATTAPSRGLSPAPRS